MGRAELLFGELASESNLKVLGKTNVDLPLRCCPLPPPSWAARHRSSKWQFRLWKYALRTPANIRHAALITGVIALGLLLLDLSLEAATAIIGATFGVALFSAAWTQITLHNEQFEAENN